MEKSADAFRTISEVSDQLDTPAHVLRFWESRFPQIRPVKRAGGRRYYRPSDIALLAGIKRLLHDDGLTIRGVQKVLREQGIRHVAGLSLAEAVVSAPLADADAAAPQEVPADTASPKAERRQTPSRRPVTPLPKATDGRVAEPLPLWAAVVERIGNGSVGAVPSPSLGAPEPEVWLPALLRRLSPAIAADDRDRLIGIQSRLLALHNRVADAARQAAS